MLRITIALSSSIKHVASLARMPLIVEISSKTRLHEPLYKVMLSLHRLVLYRLKDALISLYSPYYHRLSFHLDALALRLLQPFSVLLVVRRLRVQCPLIRRRLCVCVVFVR